MIECRKGTEREYGSHNVRVQPASWRDMTAKPQKRPPCGREWGKPTQREMHHQGGHTADLFHFSLVTLTLYGISCPWNKNVTPSASFFTPPTGTGLTCELCDLTNKWNVLLLQVSLLTGLRRINRNEGIWLLSWGLSEEGKAERIWNLMGYSERSSEG